MTKQIAREVGLALGSMAVGEPTAKLAYKAAAKLAGARRQVKKSNNKKKMNKPSQVYNTRLNSAAQNKFYSTATPNGMVLSRSTSKYLKAFLDPFSFDVKNVGSPRPGAIPSFKCTGFVRGIGFIGNAGVGYVWFAPTLANNTTALGVTTAGYTHSITSPIASDGISTDPGGANSPQGVTMTNLPYTWTELTDATTKKVIEGRIVSSSLRVYYTGTQLNMSGQFYGYTDPDMMSVVGPNHVAAVAPTLGYSPAELGAKDACEISAVGKNDMRLVIVPPTENFLDYPNLNSSTLRKTYPFSSNTASGISTGAAGAPCCVIMVTGVPGQSFYYEAITHAEFVGPGVMQSLLSESYTDAIGYDACNTVLLRSSRRAANDPRCDFTRCVREELVKDRIRMT